MRFCFVLLKNKKIIIERWSKEESYHLMDHFVVCRLLIRRKIREIYSELTQLSFFVSKISLWEWSLKIKFTRQTLCKLGKFIDMIIFQILLQIFWRQIKVRFTFLQKKRTKKFGERSLFTLGQYCTFHLFFGRPLVFVTFKGNWGKEITFMMKLLREKFMLFMVNLIDRLINIFGSVKLRALRFLFTILKPKYQWYNYPFVWFIKCYFYI